MKKRKKITINFSKDNNKANQSARQRESAKIKISFQTEGATFVKHS